MGTGVCPIRELRPPPIAIRDVSAVARTSTRRPLVNSDYFMIKSPTRWATIGGPRLGDSERVIIDIVQIVLVGLPVALEPV